jgi:curli production assembly/transport component CsgG
MGNAKLTPVSRSTRDLTQLPKPDARVPVAVYAFRDQTGQFKGQPDSNLSNAVTQGAATLLVKALLDSGWYMPMEREGFQNLLTERRVARAIEVPADKGKPGSSYPALIPANYIFEGGITGYETNVRTGGAGANYLGIGGETKYRVDQVTVNLRSVDVRTGQIVNSVSVTKTLFSHEISSSVFQYVAYKTLLQLEGGFSSNEPSQLAVKEALETAVIHLTIQGIRDKQWNLRNPQDWNAPIIQSYLRDYDSQANLTEQDPNTPIPLNPAAPAPASAPGPVAVVEEKPQEVTVAKRDPEKDKAADAAAPPENAPGVISPKAPPGFAEGFAAAQRGDYLDALVYWQPLASLGYAPAQHNVALMYQRGLGVPAKPDLAVTWFTKAADGGYVQSMNQLAAWFETGGYGLAPDLQRSLQWYRKSAAAGDKWAKDQLSRPR